MRSTPLLLLAYNRPDNVQRLIDRLRETAPQKLMVTVDGPKPSNEADAAKVAAVHKVIESIDWTDDVETRLRPVNLGLRLAVADAVTWATDAHGEVIVLEEDTLPGPHFVPYATHMLERYRDEAHVAHISGYNIVPPAQLTGTANSRFTHYPESIAWATWGRAWKAYDDSLEWGSNVSITELAAITGSRISAARWKQNFADAASGRIGTWAYRWIASMWSTGASILSPNHNLVTYAGYDEGTNSVLKAPWDELPLYDGSLEDLVSGEVDFDPKAEAWTNRRVFGGTAYGVARGVAVSAALEVRKARRAARAKKLARA